MKKIFLLVVFAVLSLSVSAQWDRVDEVRNYIAQGIKLHDEGKYEEAIKMFDKVLKTNPKNPTALYEKAYSLNAMGKQDEARKLLEKGINIAEPTLDYAGMYLLLGAIYDDQGKIDKSIETYEKALHIEDINPEYAAQLLYNLGITYFNAHLKLDDKDNKYAVKCIDNLNNSFIYRPLHPRTNINLYKIHAEYQFFCQALIHLSLYSISSQGSVEGLDEIFEDWAKAEIPAGVSYRSPQDSLVINKVIEIGKQPRSEYGIVYDVFTGVFSALCANIKDEPVHPYELVNDTTDRNAILSLYAKFLRDGELETFMHIAAKSSQKSHIVNADWCSQNKERVSKVVNYINEGQFLCDLKDYKIQTKLSSDMTAEQAKKEKSEAKQKMKSFLTEKPNSDTSREYAQYITQWMAASPDVMITISDNEIKWIDSEEKAPLLIAYVCGCSLKQLQDKNAEFTPESYIEGYKAMLKYYDDNRDTFGAILEFNNFIKLQKENPAKFEEEIKKLIPQMKK